MTAFAKKIDNPVEALILVGSENSELHEELASVYAEVDLYRDALMAIDQLKDKQITAEDRCSRALEYAKAALEGRRLAVWDGIAVRKTRILRTQ